MASQSFRPLDVRTNPYPEAKEAHTASAAALVEYVGQFPPNQRVAELAALIGRVTSELRVSLADNELSSYGQRELKDPDFID